MKLFFFFVASPNPTRELHDSYSLKFIPFALSLHINLRLVNFILALLNDDNEIALKMKLKEFFSHEFLWRSMKYFHFRRLLQREREYVAGVR